MNGLVAATFGSSKPFYVLKLVSVLVPSLHGESTISLVVFIRDFFGL